LTNYSWHNFLEISSLWCNIKFYSPFIRRQLQEKYQWCEGLLCNYCIRSLILIS